MEQDFLVKIKDNLERNRKELQKIWNCATDSPSSMTLKKQPELQLNCLNQSRFTSTLQRIKIL